MAIRGVLGLNARNHLYLARYNPKPAKRIANSKLLTKSTLRKVKLSVPKLYRVFRRQKETEEFDFTRLPDSFVIKPNRGFGGEGIIVIERGSTFAGEWVDTGGVTWKAADFKLHIEDILQGRFA